MTNERVQIAFAIPNTETRILQPDEYRSIMYLDAGVEVVESSGVTTLYPWSAIFYLRKIPVGVD